MTNYKNSIKTFSVVITVTKFYHIKLHRTIVISDQFFRKFSNIDFRIEYRTRMFSLETGFYTDFTHWRLFTIREAKVFEMILLLYSIYNRQRNVRFLWWRNLHFSLCVFVACIHSHMCNCAFTVDLKWNAFIGTTAHTHTLCILIGRRTWFSLYKLNSGINASKCTRCIQIYILDGLYALIFIAIFDYTKFYAIPKAIAGKHSQNYLCIHKPMHTVMLLIATSCELTSY